MEVDTHLHRRQHVRGLAPLRRFRLGVVVIHPPLRGLGLLPESWLSRLTIHGGDDVEEQYAKT